MAKIQKRASIYKSYRDKPQKFVQDIFSPAHYNAHCVGMVVNYLSRWRENYDIGYLLHAKRYLSKIDKTDFIFRSAYCLGLYATMSWCYFYLGQKEYFRKYESLFLNTGPSEDEIGLYNSVFDGYRNCYK